MLTTKSIRLVETENAIEPRRIFQRQLQGCLPTQPPSSEHVPSTSPLEMSSAIWLSKVHHLSIMLSIMSGGGVDIAAL